MNIFPKRAVYVIAFCAVLTLAAFSADTRFPSKTSAASTPDLMTPLPTAAETVEETVTLSASNLKTSAHSYQWWTGPSAYCGPPMHMFPSLDDSAGGVLAGYEHYYDKGAKVLGCPDGAIAAFRGAVWFDLSSIASKAPPLHVSVKSALLRFKKDRECPGQELLIAQEDWLKGIPEDTVVAGDSLAVIPACAPPECVRDVTTVANNWVRGEDHGGYTNYGFAIKGPIEGDLKFGDNDICVTRYSDFSLTVTYRYDKTAPSAPGPPNILVAPDLTRKNVARASNGAIATASSTMTGAFFPSTVIDGDRSGVNFLKGRGWIGAAPTNNDWLQVDFGGSKTINEIDVYMLRDDYLNPEIPGSALRFTKYGLIDFAVQYRSRFGEWLDVPGGKVTGNMNVLRTFKFPELSTKQIRVLVSKTPDGYSRLVEVEAWAK